MAATTSATPSVTIEAERPIAAPADVVYPLIADYRQHHAKFLPPAFSNLVVEQGGLAEGTVISFVVNLGGRRRHFRSRVTEPIPGRLLEATDLSTGTATSFEVRPAGAGSVVRISTLLPLHVGPVGWLERAVAPRLLRRLNEDVLLNLDRYAQELSS